MENKHQIQYLGKTIIKLGIIWLSNTPEDGLETEELKKLIGRVDESIRNGDPQGGLVFLDQESLGDTLATLGIRLDKVVPDTRRPEKEISHISATINQATQQNTAKLHTGNEVTER